MSTPPPVPSLHATSVYWAPVMSLALCEALAMFPFLLLLAGIRGHTYPFFHTAQFPLLEDGLKNVHDTYKAIAFFVNYRSPTGNNLKPYKSDLLQCMHSVKLPLQYNF